MMINILETSVMPQIKGGKKKTVDDETETEEGTDKRDGG